MEGAAYSPHEGNRLLEDVSNCFNIPLDQVNFVASQLISLLLSPVFRLYFHPRKTNVKTRHIFLLVVGVFLGYFAFGMHILHLFVLPSITYAILILMKEHSKMPFLTLVVSMAYLSIIHIHRLIYYSGAFTLDITGPLMVIVQKITSLAYCLHDGLSNHETSKGEENLKIRKTPSVLEYYAYMLQYQTLMAGPLVFYNDYISFVNGENISKFKKRDQPDPSPLIPGAKKIIASIIYAAVFIFVTYPISRVQDDDFLLHTSVLYKMLYLILATTLVRFKYYHAWVLSEGICNLSGLGFEGYDKNGNEKWELVANVNFIKFEFGSSLKDSIAAWNITTNKWLKLIVYNRVKKNKVVLTFALSALWHGFFPGYYLTFATGALFTVAAKSVRMHIRPKFQTSTSMKKFYDLITIVATRFIVAYTTFSFVLLEFVVSVCLFWHMYFFLHILAIAIIVLPKFLGQSEDPYHKISKLVANNNGVNSLHG